MQGASFHPLVQHDYLCQMAMWVAKYYPLVMTNLAMV